MTIQLLKPGFIFLTLFLIFAVNAPDNLISQLGFSQNTLIATLCAVVLTWFCSKKNLLLILLTVSLATLANLNAARIGSISLALNQEVLMTTLVIFILLPFIVEKMK